MVVTTYGIYLYNAVVKVDKLMAVEAIVAARTCT